MFTKTNLCHPAEGFHFFLEHLSDAVIYLRKDFDVEFANTASITLLNPTSFTFFSELCQKNIAQLKEHGQWTGNTEYVLEGGDCLRININITSLQITEHNFEGFLITCKNQTVREHTKVPDENSSGETHQFKKQQETAAVHDCFFYVNKVSSDAFWDWDIIEDTVNRGEVYFRLSGSYLCELSMKQHFQLIHIKDRKKVVKSLQTALDSNDDFWQEEYRFLCADGSFHFIVDKGYIIRNEKGVPVRMIGAMADVSQNRRLEKVLIEKEEAKKKEIIKAIIEAQEKERAQISYELHEQLSQNLATCKLLLDGLHFPESKEEERTRLKSSMKLLTQTMNQIRNMSHQLNASAIKMVGLIGVMRDLTSTVNQNWQVEVLLKCYGFTETTILPKDIEVSAFRIFQEGLNNVIRHSGATQASVQITKKNKWLILSIKDNGKGFNTAVTSKGLGFTNIINRVDYHNGIVSIDSSEGNGCLLEVKLPILYNANDALGM